MVTPVLSPEPWLRMAFVCACLKDERRSTWETTQIAAASGAVRRDRIVAATGTAQRSGDRAHRRPAARDLGEPDARSSRCVSGFPGERHSACTRILAKRSPMSSKASLEYQFEGKPPITLKAGKLLVHPGTGRPTRQGIRQHQRGRARHVPRRQREAARRAGSGGQPVISPEAKARVPAKLTQRETSHEPTRHWGSNEMLHPPRGQST